MKPDSKGVHGNEEAQRKLGLFNETYRKGLFAMNTGKNWPIQAKKQGCYLDFLVELLEGCVERVFFLLCKASELSEYLPQPLWNTPTIIPMARDQSLPTLKGVANV